MYDHSQSRKLLRISQTENLTFPQMTFREISRISRTTPFNWGKLGSVLNKYVLVVLITVNVCNMIKKTGSEHDKPTLKTDPRHREDETWNTNSHKASRRQLKQTTSSIPLLFSEMNGIKYFITRQGPNTNDDSNNKQ